MLANAFFGSTVVFLAVAFYLLAETKFLIPYRQLILNRHAKTIAFFAALLFCNLLAGIFALSRRFFLKDTGRKLAHLEKQLRSRASISEELTQRISEEE
jgi:MFS-type transporter involved in bile tolerance (Atg22 family)